MNNLRKGVVCGVAGLSAFGIGLSIGGASEITPSSIEECANSLQEAGPNATTIPDTCFNSTYMVFPMVEVTTVVVSDSNEKPYPFESYAVTPLSPGEYSLRAQELMESQESKVLLQKLASFTLGLGVAGVAYYEWAINTRERRAFMQQNQTAGPQA